MAFDLSTLADDDLRWVSREAYRNPEIYAAEQERIFKRCWMFLGHESQVAAPGDFFTTYMGEEPIIVTRDSQGTLNAFINSCRHRGMRVCRADRGSARHFSCPYHAWTYDLTGALIGVPKHKDGYYQELDLATNGLIRVAQVDSYKGLIFGTFDATAASLLDYLGDMAWYMDLVLDRHEGGTELVPGVHKWIIRTNWKIACDNNAGDWYHVPVSHGSMARLNNNPNQFDEDPNRLQVSAETGHTLAAYLAPKGAERPTPPNLPKALVEWRRHVESQVVDRLGDVRARMQFIAGNVFPNFGWIPGSFSIRQYHPRGPDEIEIWSYCLIDAAAPQAAKDAMRRMYTNTFGPGGMLEQDDGENWTGCAQSVGNPVMGQQSFNYQMGHGHDWQAKELKAQHLGKGTAEVVQRSFYRRWREEMERADSKIELIARQG
ncbi:MAG: Rieske 2Fe-2S domain-containing protein [Gammaproteobacteria bacterium]|nr:Rieske 2Fe-2S domain-containing protein [Gammaproteobacteria bacterium]